jgi:hypothetical protein
LIRIECWPARDDRAKFGDPIYCDKQSSGMRNA